MRKLGAGALRYVRVRKRGTALVLVVMFLSVVAAALAHVSLRLGVIRYGYSISEKTQRRRALEEENRKLKLEQSFLKNPERIEKIATEKLGMTRPDGAHIRLVEPTKVALQ